jgi:hypothetical protein
MSRRRRKSWSPSYYDPVLRGVDAARRVGWGRFYTLEGWNEGLQAEAWNLIEAVLQGHKCDEAGPPCTAFVAAYRLRDLLRAGPPSC